MSTVFDELAAEILHHYAAGRQIVAVDSAAPAAAGAAADALAEALRAAGAAGVTRARATADDFVESVARPFRTAEDDALLVVDGALLGTAAATALSWSMWVDVDGPDIGGSSTRTKADAILDLTDPAHPIRRFSDWCVIPRR